MRKKLRFNVFVLFFALFAGLAADAHASVTLGKSLFGRGKFRLSGYGGAASTFDQNYVLLGVGGGYFLTNGLELGIDGEAWLGNDPNIYKVTPQLRYVFYQAERIMPYVGTFYRRTFYEGISDLDSYGGRAGIYSPLGGRGYAGVGYVYEKLADCNEKIYKSCDSSYPEVSFSIGF